MTKSPTTDREGAQDDEPEQKPLTELSDEEKARAIDRLRDYDMSFVTRQLEAEGMSNARELEAKFRRYLKAVIEQPEAGVEPSEEVDAYWHKFVLNTRKYHEFCEDIVGVYLHHVPYVPSEEEVADGPRDVDEAMPSIDVDAPYRQTHVH